MQLINRNSDGARNIFYRSALLICAFLLLFSVSFAQTKSKNKKPTNANLPKVTKVDEVSIKKLLVPNGKPLLVNFWATWCVPCREEFPDLVEIDNEYKGKIDFITISLDDLAEIERDVPKFLSEMKAEMPAYLLYTNEESQVISSIAKDWQGGLPFTILYNEKGEIVHFKQGKIKPEIVKAEINKLVNPTVAKISDAKIVSLPINREIFSYKKGIEDAKSDIADGKYLIKYYGLVPMATPEYTDKLKREHGIEIIYHGCLVSAEMVEYGKGYNEISRAAIKEKFGEKILEQ